MDTYAVEAICTRILGDGLDSIRNNIPSDEGGEE